MIALNFSRKYRRNVDGYFTERSLQEYLVLATVFETCAFNNVNVLKFMLTKETTLEGLMMMAGRTSKDRLLSKRAQHPQPDVPGHPSS